MKVFLDSASLSEMQQYGHVVDGFTTNPTLMRKSGITDYLTWAREAADLGKPISFEVVAEEPSEMIRQATKLAGLGNVYVKIPVVNSKGEFNADTIKHLSKEGVKLNVTAILTRPQIRDTIRILDKEAKVILSVFAGRIADTGITPVPTIRFAVKHTRMYGFEVLWASPRQVLDVHLCQAAGCDIITVSKDILAKIKLAGKDLTEYSRETSEQFYKDALEARYSL